MDRVSSYFAIAKSLLRVPTYLLLLMYLLGGFFAGLVIMGTDPETVNWPVVTVKLLVCGLIIACWYINGTALNDYADYEIDLINLKDDKDRPLVAGTATRRELLYVALLDAAGAIGLAALISSRHLALLGLLLVLNVTYSIRPFRISRRGGLAPLVLPLGYVVLPYFFGYELTDAPWGRLPYFLIAAFYLQFLGRIILKDYRDVKGDKAHGKMTFLLKYGNSMVCTVSAAAISLSCLILVVLAGARLNYFRYAIVSLVCFGLVTLHELSRVHVWPKQKPLIAAFGRSMTGVTAAVIAAFVTAVWRLSTIETLFTAVVLAAVYFWSAQEAFAYNTRRLSK